MTMDRQLKTTDIDKKLSQVEGFLGAFAYDEIPRTPTDRFSFVVNDDPSTKPGSHWIAVIFKNKTFFFIDSYGRSYKDETFPKQFRETMKDLFGSSNVKCNTRMLQNLFSNSCGEYTVYFIREMAEKSFMTVLSVFSENLKNNDNIVIKYFKTL